MFLTWGFMVSMVNYHYELHEIITRSIKFKYHKIFIGKCTNIFNYIFTSYGGIFGGRESILVGLEQPEVKPVDQALVDGRIHCELPKKSFGSEAEILTVKDRHSVLPAFALRFNEFTVTWD